MLRTVRTSGLLSNDGINDSLVGSADDQSNRARGVLSTREFSFGDGRRANQIVAVVDANLAILNLGRVVVAILEFNGVLQSGKRVR